MIRLCVLLCLCVLGALGNANDGYISYGGAPKLMGSHPTVQMVSEKVTVTIHRDYALVNCRFDFKNHGSKTSVRMGFPDVREPWDTYFKVAPKFEWFKAYVDGRSVKTYFLAGGDKGWHIKHVNFARGQTRWIRNYYRVPLGGSVLEPKARNDKSFNNVSNAGYILHTGGSW